MCAYSIRRKLVKANINVEITCLSELKDVLGQKYMADLIDLMCDRIRDSILAVGSSPMVLQRVLERNVKPRLIIATPSGFLRAPEIKQRLLESDLEYITVLGSLGSSVLAVAIFNALVDIYMQLRVKILSVL